MTHFAYPWRGDILPLQQSEVVLDGHAIPLTDSENNGYWKTLSRERQLLFSTYSLISNEIIYSSAGLRVINIWLLVLELHLIEAMII